MHKKLISLLIVSSAVLAGCEAQKPSEGEILAYGKHLAEECFACHQSTPSEPGKEPAIPTIVGIPKDKIRKAMLEYQSGKRTNAAMVSVANSLDGEQISAIASYLSSVK